MLNSIAPSEGGYWHAEQVNKLLKEGQLADMADTLASVLTPATPAPSVGPSKELCGAPAEGQAEGPWIPSPPTRPRRRNRQAA